MKNRCPVCGFENMPFPPEDHNICSCCGTEFGYHDLLLSHAELRRRWLERGAVWFSARMPPPADWSATDQVNRALLIGPEPAANASGFSVSPSLTVVNSVRSHHRRKKKRMSAGRSVFHGNYLSGLHAYSGAQ
jgi:hypothetical protein